MDSNLNYSWTSQPSFHLERRRQLIKKYGKQIEELSKPNPWTSLIIAMLVGGQFVVASYASALPWWGILLSSYLFGAFIQHALYVLIHECCHNLIFKGRWPNKIMGLLCDLPLTIPSALAFRKYHMYHHRHLGDIELDPDVTEMREAQWIGNSRWRKFLWITFFMFSQAVRPSKMHSVKLWNSWIVTNIIVVALVNIAIVAFLGWSSLIYLAFSTFFGLGLHPLGGRWIQEHYVTRPGQETYSYYGPLNLVTFNMGFHNEHHDLMNIPWNNLPKLKKLAPEFYEPLKSCKSWTWVLFNFIWNKDMSPFSRIVHCNPVEETTSPDLKEAMDNQLDQLHLAGQLNSIQANSTQVDLHV